jgi:MFS family permease
VAAVTVFARYGAVLRGQGTATPLVASLVGRLSLGTTSLALLLLVRDTSGSYATAGIVSGAYALSFGVIGPAVARRADRSGPVPALRLTALAHPVLLVAAVVVASADAPLAALLVPTVLAGATVPPLGPVMRALWAAVLDSRALPAAYSLESVVVELCFVLGPLLVSVLTLLSGPAAPVLASAVLAGVGALWLSCTARVRSVRPHEQRAERRTSALSSAAVRALLLTVVGVGASFGAVEVAVPAFVEQTGGRPSAAGLLLAVWSAGSIVGGLVYGGLHLRAPHRSQLPVLVTALAVGTALPLLATGPTSMAVALFCFGLTIAPFSACNSVLLGQAAPTGTVTEAFAWSTSSIFGGAALASGLAGALVESSGPAAALLATAGAGLLAAAASGAAWWRSAPPRAT